MSRPKGYADWKPQPHVMEVLVQVREILNAYASYGPMTARQIFYRLVGQYGYGKTEKAYKNLTGYLVRARRARLIPFHAIRDDGTVIEGGGGYPSQASFWRTVRYSAEGFELDHQQNQPYEIELWCEAAGMAPMLARMVSEWHIPVYSTGGFSSVTVTYETAKRIARSKRPTVMLHVGDLDPSGDSIFASMAQDIGSFVSSEIGGYLYPTTGRAEDAHERVKFEPVRVALTREQADEYELPTAPPKASDSRSANWHGETVQLEAFRPDQIEEVVQEAVGRYIDVDTLEDTLEREEEEKQDIMRRLESISD